MDPAEKPLVCVIDDEISVRDLAEKILTKHGYAVRSYGLVSDFLTAFDEAATACIVTDLRMPEHDGMHLQRQLKQLGSIVALIVLTGYADVRTAVQIMEDGALTLLEKPYEASDLIAAVARAVVVTRTLRKKRDDLQMARRRFEQLTDEERAVLDLVVGGFPNKAIAMKLNMSMRTVDRRRQGLLTKMDVQSAAQLAALIAQLKE